MEEVGGFLAGERDYKNLKGGTGPLVYPAGFVYLYSFLQKSTLGSVRPAQWFFAGVYLATHAVVLALYVKSRVVPPLSLTLLSLSKRLHSIYLLRCFNDGAAMLLAWGATLLLVRALSSDDGGGKKEQGGGKGKSSNGVGGEGGSRKKSLLVVASVAAFSLAVSVKMNVLLMAPPVAVLLLQAARVQEIASGVLFGTALQVLLGLPFLLRFPGSYLGRAFELGRVFTHKWSVNFAFLSEEAFVSKRLALGLAAAHLGVLFAFAGWRWTRGGEGEGGKGAGKGGLVSAAAECWDASFPKKSKSKTSRSKASSSSSSSSSARHRPALAAAHVFRVEAVGNFIGVVLARSLHYQVRGKKNRVLQLFFFTPHVFGVFSLTLSFLHPFFQKKKKKSEISFSVLLLVRPLAPAPPVVDAVPIDRQALDLAGDRGRVELFPALAARLGGAVGGAPAAAGRALGRRRGG